MMRLTKIVLAVCIFAAVIIGALLWFGKVEFLTQKAESLERVIIIYNPSYPEIKRDVYITEYSKMEQVYRILNETTEISVNKYPVHSDSIQWDSKFAICLEYHNGVKEKFFSTEKHGGVYRFLDTKGSSGDSGYISGLNEKVWKYVFSLEGN